MKEYCDNVGLPWNEEIKNNINNKVRTMGSTIIADKGKTHYGIATCVCSIADAILNQRLTIATVSTPLTGEYNISGVALSLPSIIGVNGVEHRLVEELSPEEFKALKRSALKMQETLSTIK